MRKSIFAPTESFTESHKKIQYQEITSSLIETSKGLGLIETTHQRDKGNNLKYDPLSSCYVETAEH